MSAITAKRAPRASHKRQWPDADRPYYVVPCLASLTGPILTLDNLAVPKHNLVSARSADLLQRTLAHTEVLQRWGVRSSRLVSMRYADLPTARVELVAGPALRAQLVECREALAREYRTTALRLERQIERWQGAGFRQVPRGVGLRHCPGEGRYLPLPIEPPLRGQPRAHAQKHPERDRTTAGAAGRGSRNGCAMDWQQP